MFSSTFFTTHLIKNSIQMIMCVREVLRLRTYMNSPLILFHIYTSTFPYLSTFFLWLSKKIFYELFYLPFSGFSFSSYLCCSLFVLFYMLFHSKYQRKKYFILCKEPFWPENLLSEWVINLYDLQRMNK